MPIFEVTLPIIRGFEVFTVQADTEAEAIEATLNGDIIDSEFARVETDFDSNLAQVAQIED